MRTQMPGRTMKTARPGRWTMHARAGSVESTRSTPSTPSTRSTRSTRSARVPRGARSLTTIAMAASMILAGASPAHSADWPVRPVRMILPSAAGSSPDILMRILSDELAKQWGQQVVVDNRPGASGQIAMALVKDASPDGYIIGYANIGTLAVNPALFEKLSYDPLRDFALIAPVVQVSNIMVVNTGSQYKSVLDVVEAARRQPGKLLFASSAAGTTSHLSSELLMFQTKIRMVHVPYKGSPQSIADLAAGQVDLTFENMGVLLPHVRSGRLRALAVTSPRRSAALPAVPTMVEAGVPGFEMTAWGGIVAPVKMPAARVQWMNGEINKALASPVLRERFANADSEPTGGSAQDLRALVERELTRWGEIVRKAGIKAD